MTADPLRPVETDAEPATVHHAEWLWLDAWPLWFLAVLAVLAALGVTLAALLAAQVKGDTRP